MIEGDQAFERFQNAVKAALTVPKRMVVSPFGQRKKPETPKS
jgi:hypothetical protein